MEGDRRGEKRSKEMEASRSSDEAKERKTAEVNVKEREQEVERGRTGVVDGSREGEEEEVTDKERRS